MITNGYLLVAERIQRLNRAGLEWLQISIDNVMPDEVSKKSLKVLDKKLRTAGRACRLPREHQFRGRRRHPQSAGCAGHRQARDGTGLHLDRRNHSRWRGQLQPLSDEERAVYHEMKAMEKSSFTRINCFQDNIAQGQPNQWRCRAGARYLYICEDGLVHYCSQQRGYPGMPLGEVHASKTFAANI